MGIHLHGDETPAADGRLCTIALIDREPEGAAGRQVASPQQPVGRASRDGVQGFDPDDGVTRDRLVWPELRIVVIGRQGDDVETLSRVEIDSIAMTSSSFSRGTLVGGPNAGCISANNGYSINERHHAKRHRRWARDDTGRVWEHA